MEQMICKAKAEGRCEGKGYASCEPHSRKAGCNRSCKSPDSQCIPYAPEIFYVCNRMGMRKQCKFTGCIGMRPRTLKQLENDCSGLINGIKCGGEWCHIKAIPVPYAPEWICDHAGGCQVKKGKWCAFPFEGKTKFQGKRKFPGLGHTLLDALVWKRQPCEWTGFHVKAIPYKPKEDTVEKQYESLKPISIKALEEAGACERELHRFAYLAGMKGFDYTATIYIDDAVEIASKCKGGIQFLIDGGFIREKVLENPFKEVSVHQSHDGDWEIHVSNGSGHSWIMGTLTPHGLRMWNMYTDVFPVNDDGRIKIID